MDRQTGRQASSAVARIQAMYGYIHIYSHYRGVWKKLWRIYVDFTSTKVFRPKKFCAYNQSVSSVWHGSARIALGTSWRVHAAYAAFAACALVHQYPRSVWSWRGEKQQLRTVSDQWSWTVKGMGHGGRQCDSSCRQHSPLRNIH